MKRLLVLALPLMTTVPLLGQGDMEGCTDHALITRYPGSELQWCFFEEYRTHHIAHGPVTAHQHIDDWIEATGKLTRLLYVLPEERTLQEVYQNYRSALTDGDFEILAEGVHPNPTRYTRTEVGGAGFKGVYFAKNPFPPSSAARVMSMGSATTGGSGYVAGKKTNAEGASIYIAITGYVYAKDVIAFMVDILEEGGYEEDLIKVTADYMWAQLEAKGHVPLYIEFDYDKAVIKEESQDIISEMARLMEEHPELNVYVVGHTDMKGTLAYNLDLSSRRATAVVATLTDEYGADPERLNAQGVGPLSPKSTNADEMGRKKNRRVELVRKL